MVESARDEATHDQSRPENKYDTRALEASYLAAGQGVRVAELGQLSSWLEQLAGTGKAAAGVGSLVHLSGDGERWVFLAPRGGPEAVVDGVTVALVSTSSPLGAALVGAEAEDEVELMRPRGPQTWDVVTVA